MSIEGLQLGFQEGPCGHRILRILKILMFRLKKIILSIVKFWRLSSKPASAIGWFIRVTNLEDYSLLNPSQMYRQRLNISTAEFDEAPRLKQAKITNYVYSLELNLYGYCLQVYHSVLRKHVTRFLSCRRIISLHTLLELFLDKVMFAKPFQNPILIANK